MSSEDITIPVEHVNVDSAPDLESSGIRLYSTASATMHGRTNARWSLQVFGRLRLKFARGRRGRPYIGTASLGYAELIKLRAAVELAITTIERESRESRSEAG